MTRAPVLLISTDFDGTLIEHGNPAPYSPVLVEILQELRQRGVRWAINTGRTMPWLEDGLRAFAWPIRPDFVITAERELYAACATPPGWCDMGDWNARCARLHGQLFATASPVLAKIIAYVEKDTAADLRFGRSRLNAMNREPAELAGLVATSVEEMDRIVAFVEPIRQQVPFLSYQRNSIYLSFCHANYDKGTVLAELGRQLGVPHESIFAVGDHENDLPMLDGAHAGHVACPGNSIDTVKAAVRSAGGYVAQATYSAGVIEALRYYCDDLPG